MQPNDINIGANDYGSTSDLRRRYPKDQEGIKDEWRALIRHQTEINEMINRREREVRQLKQDELGQAYDQKRHELIQLKEAELRQKQQEAQMVTAKADQFRQDMQRQEENRNLLQQHLANQYNQDINAKAHAEQLKKEQKLEEERRMLEDAKRRGDEAKRRELAKQEEYYNVFNEEIRRAEAKNNRLLEDKIKDKIGYKDAFNENERKQVLKEENYKNFFKLSADHQSKFMDLHAQNVLSPQIEKQKQLDSIVEKRINEERERQMQEELRRKKIKEEQLHGVGHANRDKMEYADYIKKLEKTEKQGQIQESLKQQADYQDFLRSHKNQKLEQQKNYKDFLDKQYEGQQERDQLNKMTKQEKKLNFGDLQAYKASDPKLYGLIPGFINSKYSNPLGAGEYRQGGEGRSSIALGDTQQGTYGGNITSSNYDSSNNYQAAGGYQASNAAGGYQASNAAGGYQAPSGAGGYQVPSGVGAGAGGYQAPSGAGAGGYQASNSYPSNNYQAPSSQDYSAPKYDAQPYEQKGTVAPYLQNPSSPSKDKYYESAGQFGKYDGNPSGSLYSPGGRRMDNSQFSPTKGGHNPITNPLPVNMQNPYINKEITKITQRQPYFANMASNNLIA